MLAHLLPRKKNQKQSLRPMDLYISSVIVLLALWRLKHRQFDIVAGRGSRKNMDAKIQRNIPTQIQYLA